MGLTVRGAVPGDIPAMLVIYNDAVATTTATYDYEPATLAERERWFEEHRRDGYEVIVAHDDSGTIVGWGSLSNFRPRTGYRFTVEDSVYVAAEHRGRGVGRKLLEGLVAAAHRGGYRAIIAGIDAENSASIRLHAALGFEQVALLKQVGYKFDRWLDVVYMELVLPDGGP